MAAAVLLVMGQAKAPEEPQGPRWEYLVLENRWVSFKPLEQRVNGFRVLQDKALKDGIGTARIAASTNGSKIPRASMSSTTMYAWRTDSFIFLNTPFWTK